MPNNGPGARIINAYRQPTRLSTRGINSIEIVVKRNPRQVWIVRAVPRYCGSPSSVTQAENCAESATTLAPQIAATVKSTIGLAPNNNPISKQQLPLTAIAAEVTTVLPIRSAIKPANTHPTAPEPMTTKDPTSANAALLLRAARLARIMKGIQVHIAYSSHMWPK